eukprot:sb/3466417/
MRCRSLVRAFSTPPRTCSIFLRASDHTLAIPGSGEEFTGEFTFVQAADCQFGMEWVTRMGFHKYEYGYEEATWEKEKEWSRSFVRMVNKINPVVVIMCGDMLDAWPEKWPETRDRQKADFYEIYDQLKVPLLCVCGNHDVGNSPTPQTVDRYRSDFGDDWYSFVCRGLFGIVINSQYYADPSRVELRKHVRYLGGYHGSHRVILWFWDITLNEFTEEEKSSLLKFVTSCSRPPLMGFASMSPPFSIRAVDDAEQEPSDMTPGEALRSSFKSFLGLSQGSGEGSNSRLPSSSTCFNLLKLPVYRSKGVLRDKLKYAINSGADQFLVVMTYVLTLLYLKISA